MAWQFLKGLMGQNVHREPPRNEWNAIVSKMVDDLKESRGEWISACTSLLQRAVDTPFKPQLTDDTDLVTSVYQFVLAAAFIGSQEYVQPESGRDFCTLLWAEIGAGRNPTRRSQVYETFIRLRAGDDGQDIGYLVRSVAKEIVGTPVFEALGLAGTVPTFTSVTYGIVADAFGDQATVKRVQQQIR